MIQAKFDPKVRTVKNGVCIGFDDIDNGLLVTPGETMLLYCPELHIKATAIVDEVNYNSQIVFLTLED